MLSYYLTNHDYYLDKSPKYLLQEIRKLVLSIKENWVEGTYLKVDTDSGKLDIVFPQAVLFEKGIISEKL